MRRRAASLPRALGCGGGRAGELSGVQPEHTALLLQRFKSSVYRRYNDFVVFHEMLLQKFPYRMVPALPPKRVLGGEAGGAGGRGGRPRVLGDKGRAREGWVGSAGEGGRTHVFTASSARLACRASARGGALSVQTEGTRAFPGRFPHRSVFAGG